MKPLSKCCKEEIKFIEIGEGAGYIVCSKCKKSIITENSPSPHPDFQKKMDEEFELMERNHGWIPEHKERMLDYLHSRDKALLERVIGEVEKRQKLFNFIPVDRGGYKYVKARDLDILSIIKGII